MPEKIEITYDSIKEGEGKMEEYKLVNLSGADGRRILELVDQKDIDIEDILSFLKKFIKKGKGGKNEMTNNQETNDEERFSKEVKIVEKYQESHPGVSYRDAVLASLDRTEPELPKQFTEDEIKKRENFKAVENYLSANPRASWKDAVKVVLRGEELSLETKLVEEYMEKNPGKTYRDAILEVLPLLKKEE